MPDNRQARATLSFQVPTSTGGEGQVFVTARDVLDCPTTVGFGLVFSPTSNAPPTARIRFDHDGDSQFSGPFASGHTVQIDNRTILLDASQSTDDGGEAQLSYSWSVSGIAGATLSSTGGTQTSLAVPSEATGMVQVILTATDSGSLSGTTTVNFVIIAEGEGPTARIRYDEDRDGEFSGPFSSGHVVQTSYRTIDLDATTSSDGSGLGDLTFLWTLSAAAGMATLSPVTGPSSTLSVDPSRSGSVTVTLTAANPEGLSSQATLTFSISRGSPVAQLIQVPERVDSGSEFKVRASAVTGGGGGAFSFNWTAVEQTGAPLELCPCTGAGAALISAPQLDTGEESRLVTVTVAVREGDMASEPVSAEILVTKPMMYFSQVAVGPLSQTEQLESSVVVVNSNLESVDATVVFWNNAEGESWAVRVDGEPASDLTMNLPPGGTPILTLTGDQVDVGWASMISTAPLTGHLFYRVTQNGTVIREVPVLPTSGMRFRTALGPGPNTDLALALVNPGQSPIRFVVRVEESDGSELLQTGEITLAAAEHFARFLPEVLQESGGFSIPGDFIGGALVIEAVQGGELAATVLKTQGGLSLSILPVGTEKP